MQTNFTKPQSVGLPESVGGPPVLGLWSSSPQNPMRSGRRPANTARMAVFRYMIPTSRSNPI